MIFSYQHPQKVPTHVIVSSFFWLTCNILISNKAIIFKHVVFKPDNEIFSVSLINIKQALKPKVKTDPATALPEAYKNFLNVINYEEANKLPPHRPGVEHIIYMQPGIRPPARPLCGMNRDELQVLKKYLEDNQSKGFI